ncbi:GTPase [Inquilinus sp. CAU 1745]|uniref:flagellar biosynthesis protein FlhF n=1 Tax=Inquilinus sp. CAU 1745 TaxID=3140369 RepID=UPI00325ADDFF
MRLKSFTAPTVAEAMAQIRETLGDAAIIVATNDDRDGGVRVTAAIDEETVRKPPPRPARTDAPDPADGLDAIYRAMRSHGVPAIIGEALLDRIAGFDTRDPGRALSAGLRDMFGFSSLANREDGRPIVMVGPPGVGKTQTTAKLAARALMAGQSVSLITTDTDRTGGGASLAAFAEAMKLPLARADTPTELRSALAETKAADLVVIDTAGRNHLQAADMVALGRFLVLGGMEPVLALPAGLDPVEAGDIAKAFADLGARRLVATRVDMARRLGSLLAAAHAANLAFAEYGDTPRIKDGIVPFDPPALARLLLTDRHDNADARQPRSRQAHQGARSA